jgi:hypothetical protein
MVKPRGLTPWREGWSSSKVPQVLSPKGPQMTAWHEERGKGRPAQGFKRHPASWHAVWTARDKSDERVVAVRKPVFLGPTTPTQAPWSLKPGVYMYPCCSYPSKHTWSSLSRRLPLGGCFDTNRGFSAAPETGDQRVQQRLCLPQSGHGEKKCYYLLPSCRSKLTAKDSGCQMHSRLRTSSNLREPTGGSHHATGSNPLRKPRPRDPGPRMRGILCGPLSQPRLREPAPGVKGCS